MDTQQSRGCLATNGLRQTAYANRWRTDGICSRIDTAATDKAPIDWLHKWLRDGGNVAFVCTKADRVNRDEVVRDHATRGLGSSQDLAA